jgi:hypothetical protein
MAQQEAWTLVKPEVQLTKEQEEHERTLALFTTVVQKFQQETQENFKATMAKLFTSQQLKECMFDPTAFQYPGLRLATSILEAKAATVAKTTSMPTPQPPVNPEKPSDAPAKVLPLPPSAATTPSADKEKHQLPQQVQEDLKALEKEAEEEKKKTDDLKLKRKVALARLPIFALVRKMNFKDIKDINVSGEYYVGVAKCDTSDVDMKKLRFNFKQESRYVYFTLSEDDKADLTRTWFPSDDKDHEICLM